MDWNSYNYLWHGVSDNEWEDIDAPLVNSAATYAVGLGMQTDATLARTADGVSPAHRTHEEWRSCACDGNLHAGSERSDYGDRYPYRFSVTNRRTGQHAVAFC